jgi:lysophospholipase L1-like esterase
MKLARPLAAASLYALIFCAILELLMRTGVIVPSFDGFLPSPVGDGIKVIMDRKVLFRIKPHSREDINGSGYRDREFRKEKPAGRRVLALGDSITAGLNVKAEETFPKVLEKKLGEGYEVYNMGVHGYGPDQSYVQLKEEGMRLNPDMVVLCLFANDFNDIFKNRLLGLDKKGNLVKNRLNIITSSAPELRILYLYDFLKFKYVSRKSYLKEVFRGLFGDYYLIDLWKEKGQKRDLMKAIIASTDSLLAENGVQFLLLYVPSFEEVALRILNRADDAMFEEGKLVDDICSGLSLSCMNFTPRFLDHHDPASLYEGKDKHLSAEGHNVVAESVLGYIKSAGGDEKSPASSMR